MKYKHVIWDWNGTVVDDVALSVEVLNSILRLKDLPEISVEHYRENFGFPVSDFYEKLGFRLDPAESERLGNLFISRYNARRFSCPMHDGVESLMRRLNGGNVRQSILSAYRKDFLGEAAAHYGVDRFMTEIAGLDDIHAATKTDLGRRLISGLDAEPSQILVIGDTDHDLEVARQNGADAALVARGHQSHGRLAKTGAQTFKSFAELERRIFGNG